MGSRPLPPVVVVHVDDLELRSVLDALLTGCPSQRKVHLRRSHVVVVCCRLDYLGGEKGMEKVEMDGCSDLKTSYVTSGLLEDGG